MSTFIEFQNKILDKLCSIEDRLSKIESVLGVSDSEILQSEPVQIADKCEETAPESYLKDEIFDFQKQLNDIKSLFD